MMPEMNGLELCSKVKSEIDYSHIPVILLTAKTTLESKVEGLECGADVYIEKPFSICLLYTSLFYLYSPVDGLDCLDCMALESSREA